MQKWANKCALCRFQKREQQQHGLEDCQDADAKLVVKMVQIITEGIHKKKRLAAFSGCYNCGIPQAICQQWKQKEEQGWFERVKGVRCQYQGVMIPVVAVIWYKGDCRGENIIREWLEKDRVDTKDEEKVYRWFGQRVKWGGIEASKLCQVFYTLTQAEMGIRE